jgi:hypothetical protein
MTHTVAEIFIQVNVQSDIRARHELSLKSERIFFKRESFMCLRTQFNFKKFTCLSGSKRKEKNLN